MFSNRLLIPYTAPVFCSRIVLYEEYRVVSTGAQRLIGIKLESEDKPSPEIRSPLTMLSLIGEFRQVMSLIGA